MLMHITCHHLQSLCFSVGIFKRFLVAAFVLERSEGGSAHILEASLKYEHSQTTHHSPLDIIIDVIAYHAFEAR